jgi:hypothetical protein
MTRGTIDEHTIRKKRLEMATYDVLDYYNAKAVPVPRNNLTHSNFCYTTTPSEFKVEIPFE